MRIIISDNKPISLGIDLSTSIALTWDLIPFQSEKSSPSTKIQGASLNLEDDDGKPFPWTISSRKLI